MLQKEKRKKINLSPAQILVIGFLFLITIGTVLLNLSVSSANNVSIGFINALFTATSAVCVTGLVVVDTATHWSSFGHIVIIFLIQIGGLGFMSMTTMFALIIGKRITLKERLVIQEALNQVSLQGLVRLIINIVIVTVIIELIGALFLSTRFIPIYGPVQGILFSLFHSVSAFCNAGFDLIGDFNSMTPFVNDVIINIVMISLIIIGGLGFTVLIDVGLRRKFKKFLLHTKLVLVITTFLISLGFFVFLILEYNNPATLGDLPVHGKLLGALFQSVTPRTAGFNTIPIADLTTASKFFTMIFMFIGGSPSSTAGGIKTVTFALVIMMVFATLKGKDDVELFGRRISKGIVNRALAVSVISLALVITVTMILTLTETGDFLDLLFETTSAFGTVGLSTGVTTLLTPLGKILITITMFFGRVGPLTLVLALLQKNREHKKMFKYPEDKVIVG